MILTNFAMNIEYFHYVFVPCEQELEDACQWLDDWERYIRTLPAPQQKQFLSHQTCRGLRISLSSTLALSKLLLSDGFSYVLTAKFNQDPLEVTLLDHHYNHYSFLYFSLTWNDCIILIKLICTTTCHWLINNKSGISSMLGRWV